MTDTVMTSPLGPILEHFMKDKYPLTTKLTAKSHEVSKPRDSSLDFSNRSDIWQAPRQQRCRDACQISERCDQYSIQSRDFESSRDFLVRRLFFVVSLNKHERNGGSNCRKVTDSWTDLIVVLYAESCYIEQRFELVLIATALVPRGIVWFPQHGWPLQ